MKKINKSVLIIYILNCIFLILGCLFSEMNGFVMILLSIIFSILTLLSFVILLVLGIINFINNKEKVVRRNLVIMLIVLILIGIMGKIVPKIIDRILKNNYKNEVVEMVEPLTGKIKNSDTNKYVYFIKDLKELDSSFDYNKYDDTSYITYFNDEIYVCMSNSKYKITSEIDGYKVSEILLFDKKYNYEITSEHAKVAAKDYLKNKNKELTVKEAEVVDNCEWDYIIPICPDYQTVELATNFGNVRIDVEVVDGELKFDDDSDYIFSKLTDGQKLKGYAEYHATKYLNVDEITLGVMIYDIHYSESTDIVFMSTSYEYEDAKEYAESLGEYLKDKVLDAKVLIRKFASADIYNTSYEYAIPIQIKDGNLKVG